MVTRRLGRGGWWSACPAAPRRRGPRGLRRRGHGHRVRRCPPAARAVSAPALAVAFFDPARELYGTRALGHDRAVRGPHADDPAGGPADRGRGRRLARAPRRGGCDARARARGARGGPRRRGGAPCAACAARWRGTRGRLPGHGGRDTRAARLGGSRRAAHDLGARRRRARRCWRSPAGRAGRAATATRWSRPGCSTRAGCSRSRTRASRPSTTATAASAAPASSCGSPARTSRGAVRGSCVAGSSLDLDGLHVHAAIFRWRIDGRDAIGAYELMVRDRPARGRVMSARSSRTSAGCSPRRWSRASSPTRRSPGVSLEELGAGDGARDARRTASTRSTSSSAGEISEGEFADAARAPSSATGSA